MAERDKFDRRMVQFNIFFSLRKLVDFSSSRNGALRCKAPFLSR